MTTRPLGPKQGAAMVESCIVVAILCLILFGFLQVSQLVIARNVLNYTAVTTSRAAAVGMNDFMLHKVSRYASIPVAGPITTPEGFVPGRVEGSTMGAVWDNAIDRENVPVSDLGEYEVAVKEAYHLATPGLFNSVLSYDNWENAETDVRFSHRRRDEIITLEITQTVPLTFPFSRVFFGHLDFVDVTRGNRVAEYPSKRIAVTSTIEDHADYYLKGD